MIDPTYDKELIKADPVWYLAWVMSEIENDVAPLGWGRYIRLARGLLSNFDITEKRATPATKETETWGKQGG
jgi:hypothetical protein